MFVSNTSSNLCSSFVSLKNNNIEEQRLNLHKKYKYFGSKFNKRYKLLENYISYNFSKKNLKSSYKNFKKKLILNKDKSRRYNNG